MLKKSLFISGSFLILVGGFILCICASFKEEKLVPDASSSILEKLSLKEVSTVSASEEIPLGYLNIPKLNLEARFFRPESELNQVNKNITVLSNKPKLMVLAAHSGSGKVAFFKDLHKLVIGDRIFLNVEDELSTYFVDRIYTTAKNGELAFSYKNGDKRIILTTCGEETGSQLIVEGIEKK